MRKIILTLVFTLMSTISFADGHSGKISLAGFFVGDAKAIVDEKGNVMTFTYEGQSGVNAIEGTSFGDNSSHHCIGAGSIPGKGCEMGHCKVMFINGATAIIYYELKLFYVIVIRFAAIGRNMVLQS